MGSASKLSLLELLQAANSKYPDGFLEEYWERTSRGKVSRSQKSTGDALARFIVIELMETWEKKGAPLPKIERAIGCLRTAISDIKLSIRGLEELWRKHAQKK